MANTHVCFILDRSSSMIALRDATISAFNEQILAIKTAARGQQTDVSLFTFSTQADDATFFAAPVGSLTELTHESYVPNGNTALFDSIMKATDQLSNLPDANELDTAFLIVTLSDGQENCSQNGPIDVKRRLEALQTTKRWTFTYLGCSESEITKMRDLGITVGNSRGFEYSAVGVASISALNCSSTGSYFAARSAGSTQVNDLYDQADAAIGVTPNVGAVSSSIIATPYTTGLSDQKIWLPQNVTAVEQIVAPIDTKDSKTVTPKV